MRWMLEVAGFEARELLLSEGPRGEFRTLNGYFLATPGASRSRLLGRAEVPARTRRLRRSALRAVVTHSPMSDAREVAGRRERMRPVSPRPTPDIDWRDDTQLELCRWSSPLANRSISSTRSRPIQQPLLGALNDQYPSSMRWVLAGLIEHLRPTRMIEVARTFRRCS